MKTIFNSGGDYEIGVNNAFVPEEPVSWALRLYPSRGLSNGSPVDANAQLTSIIGPEILMPIWLQTITKDNSMNCDAGSQLVAAKGLLWAQMVEQASWWRAGPMLLRLTLKKDASMCSALCCFKPSEKVQHFVRSLYPRNTR